MKGLVCPSCGSPINYISNSRPRQGYVIRTRVCDQCKTRQTTYEYPAEEMETVLRKAHLLDKILGQIDNAKILSSGRQPTIPPTLRRRGSRSK